MRQLHRAAATVLSAGRACFGARRPDLILNWAGEDTVLRLAGRGARWDGRPSRVVAACDRRPTLARPQRERIARARDRLLLDGGCTCPAAPVAASQHDRRCGGSRPVIAGASARAARAPRDAPCVGIVGRLQPWKGQDRLLRAQALLRERGHPFHLVIVGGDSYGLSPDYARRCRAPIAAVSASSDEVTMTGEVARRGPLHPADGRPRQRLGPRAVRDRAAGGHGAGVPVVAVDSGGPRSSSSTAKPAFLLPPARRRRSLQLSNRS